MTVSAHKLYVVEHECISLVQDALYYIKRARGDLKPTDVNLRAAEKTLETTLNKLKRRVSNP